MLDSKRTENSKLGGGSPFSGIEPPLSRNMLFLKSLSYLKESHETLSPSLK